MKCNTVLCLATVACIIAAGSTWWARRTSRTALLSLNTGVPQSSKNSVSNLDSPNRSNPTSRVSISVQIREVLTRLKASTDKSVNRGLIAELRVLLDSLPPNVASHEVRSLLASRIDAPTQLDVTVKKGGKLGDASSFRVVLLDYLGQIDREAAAIVSREILSVPTSADEWAVSLRNVAWADDSADTMEFLRRKAAEMISNTAWRKNPSAGFLEAFDVIVHARGFGLAPQIAELVRDKENRSLAYAAFLTLDRLTLSDAAAALAPLAEQPALMAGREQTRANFFARLDVSDAPQRALLEKYLLDTHRSPQELQTFAGIFPNANFMISNNLLTANPTPSHDELAVRDRVTLQVIEGWLADPRFVDLQPHLAKMRNRLRTFVQKTSAAPEQNGP